MTGVPARPQGITILAVLSAIGGVLSLLAGLALIGLGGLAASVGAGGVGFIGMIGGLLLLASGGLGLAFAYGAWKLLPWAWMLGVIAQGLSLVSSAVAVLGGAGISNQFVGILIAIGILYYLNTPAVRAAFGRP